MSTRDASRNHRARLAATLAATLLLTGCASSTATPTPTLIPTPDGGSAAGASAPAPVPSSAASAAPSATPILLPGAGSALLITQAIEAVKADPTNTTALLTLGLAYYQHARETADPTDYARADESFDRILAIEPHNAEALIGKGIIALARHDFAGGLALGQQAQRLAPRVARVYGIIGDALVELGRYPEALDAIQQMVDTRPDLGSYSRVSYQRELHGDLDGAIKAMEAAVIAGGPATENTEYVRVVLGNLWFLKGDLDKAEASYASSLAHSPGYVFALAGAARVAAAHGDMDRAMTLYQQAADRVPFPEFLIALGETQEAAGLTDASAATYRLVRQIEALFKADGVNTDLDLALFESDHDDPATALELARAAYAETPNVKAADALAWALYHNGQPDEARRYAEESLRLGSLEPSYRYHAGMIAVAQGDAPAGREYLTESLARNPAWSPLHTPRAAAALAELGAGPVATPIPTAMPGGSTAPATSLAPASVAPASVAP